MHDELCISVLVVGIYENDLRCMWLAKRSLVVVVVVNTVSLCSTFTFSHLMFIFFAFLASLQAVKISRLCP